MQHHIVLITYKFDGVDEHKVLVRSHGNSSKQKPYYRTAPSVRRNLSSALVQAGKAPKEALDKVLQDKGGLLRATSVGQIPWNRQQAYDIRYQQSTVTGTHTKAKGRDILFVTMEQCKLAEKGMRFVQEVTCAPEPMAVLATKQQLQDLERFCCSPSQFCIMGIDPTFNLGDFSVTPIVYQHLLIANASGHSPWMLGPLLVHYKKEFRNYNFFLSCLIGLRWQVHLIMGMFIHEVVLTILTTIGSITCKRKNGHR